MDLTAPTVQLADGSSRPLAPPSPLLEVSSLQAATGATAGLSVTAEAGHLLVSAASGAAHGGATVTVSGVGCDASGCGRAFVLHIPTVVTSYEAPTGTLNELPSPSPDRVAGAVGNQLSDQLIISVGSADAIGSRAQAEAAAVAANGSVSGGYSDTGVYAVRWSTPQDLAARTAQLGAATGVTSVAPSTVGLYQADSAIPVAPQFDLPQWTWPYTQVDATAAWAKTTGSNVTVGIIDVGNAYPTHEDLSVQNLGIGVPAFHSTHVAGLACAKANAVGVVGMAQGCPLVSIAGGNLGDDAIYGAMETLAHISSIKVVNVSLGLNAGGCANALQFSKVLSQTNGSWKDKFTTFFKTVGKGVVWTFSAGNNCLPTVNSSWARSYGLDNVITVAADNSDQSLASFSDYGNEVEVAAPGGVSTSPLTDGVMSTATDFGDCPPWAQCGGQCPPTSYCGAYYPDRGTSMAAPQVAGIAALARSVAPDATAGQIGKCIVSTAGTGTAGSTTGRSSLPAYGPFLFSFDGSSLPIVNAGKTVTCAQSLSAPPPPAGHWTLQSLPSAAALPGSLSRVFCLSASDCRAVGTANSQTLAARYDGATWIVQSTPNPAGATSSRLRDISCTATDACTAVGVASDSDGGFAFAERWNGSTWSLQSTAVPAGADNTSLSSVECVSITNCEAVGSYNNNQGILTGTPLAMRWNGSSWAVQPTPLPTGGVFSGLAGLSCKSTSFCVAVGYWDRGLGTTSEGVAEIYNGVSWSAQPTPIPANGISQQFGDVDCASTTACTAVGQYGNTVTNLFVPLAVRYNGTSWSVQPTPDVPGSLGTYLNGVSCPTASSCVAVGDWLTSVNGANRARTLGEHWDGSSWTLDSTPNPASPTSSNTLTGAACVAANACVAVGSTLETTFGLLGATYAG